MCIKYCYLGTSVQALSRVRLFVTPWTAARQASLSITNSQSLLNLMSHWVGDAIQPSHRLSSPSPPAFNLSQHQGLFQWVCSLHQMAKVFQLQLQHQSFQWIHKGAKAEDMGKGPTGCFSVTVPFHFLFHIQILEWGKAMEITSSKLYPFNCWKHTHTHTQCESFKLSFIWDKMRTTGWETAFQMALRNCHLREELGYIGVLH